ncbi:MAG TPA: hypothetical protein VGC42_08420, partial [Kofleriaceae bacterium]
VGLAIELTAKGYSNVKFGIAVVGMLIAMFFAHRSFYGMRIGNSMGEGAASAPPSAATPHAKDPETATA